MSGTAISLKRKSIEAVATQPAKKNALISSFFKVEPSTPSTPKKLISDKETFLSKLSIQEKELLGLELNTIHESWLAAGLAEEIRKPYFLKLKRQLNEEKKSKKIFPPENDWYNWSRLTPLDKVRVVLLGQDPYHNINQAHGLCFSVQKPTPPPPSLINIYKELKSEYSNFEIPKHGNLSNWAQRGVLLLNTSLTVQAHQAASHSNYGWQNFTQRVLEIVIQHSNTLPAKGCVFLCWGLHAKKRVDAVLSGPKKSKHLVLYSAHPSPLSAHRGFLGNNHFKTAEKWLQEHQGLGQDEEIYKDGKLWTVGNE